MTHATFDRFEFDVERRALLREGEAVHLSPKAFRLLEVLVANSPRAVSKEQLTEEIWPQTFVEESNLPGLVGELRAALGDEARTPRFVRTVHGFGYAFCAELKNAALRERAGSLHVGGEDVPIFEGANILGRDPSAQIQIDHATVSRRHATVDMASGSATLRDLDSKNGTFVDGERITGPVALADGATFVVGDVRVTFRIGRAVGSTVTMH